MLTMLHCEEAEGCKRIQQTLDNKAVDSAAAPRQAQGKLHRQTQGKAVSTWKPRLTTSSSGCFSADSVPISLLLRSGATNSRHTPDIRP